MLQKYQFLRLIDLSGEKWFVYMAPGNRTAFRTGSGHGSFQQLINTVLFVRNGCGELQAGSIY